jgi:release factor glutamine methyltransferase
MQARYSGAYMVHECVALGEIKSMKPKSIKFVRMTIREGIKHLKEMLSSIYDKNEAGNIAQLVIEHVTSFDRSQTITEKEFVLSIDESERIKKIADDLLMHKPVQYVLGEAWFMGMKFFVDENVLIPRPETEELVDLIIKSKKVKRVIDIGTGSGCIAVSIKKQLPSSEVYAIDISDKALAVAAKNAALNNVEIKFKQLDILDESLWSVLPSFDVIVSNPPYIPASEKSSMSSNVIDFEPHTALFVPSTKPLLFYKKIIRFAENQGIPCTLFFEIHENAGEDLKELFARYTPVIKKDLQGKDRMLVLTIP